LIRKTPNLPLAIFWPNQQTGGVHVNVSGAGITTHTKHKQAAVDLLEWLSTPNAQNLFADANLEYPANSTVKSNPIVAEWGTFKQSPINLKSAGAFQADAIRLMDRAGYK